MHYAELLELLLQVELTAALADGDADFRPQQVRWLVERSVCLPGPLVQMCGSCKG